MPALFEGIPGWRKWIWEFVLERINAKAAHSARQALGDLVPAWVSAHAPQVSPAAALAQTLASRPETAATLTLPTVWPAHLQIHVFVRGSTGRRFLMHIDPSFGDAELFAASRRLLFGENPTGKPWTAWAAVMADLGSIPPALSWRGLQYGADPLALPMQPGGQSQTEEAKAHAPGFREPTKGRSSGGWPGQSPQWSGRTRAGSEADRRRPGLRRRIQDPGCIRQRTTQPSDPCSRNDCRY